MKNTLVRARTVNTNNKQVTNRTQDSTKLHEHMNTQKTLTNHQTNTTVYVDGGNATDYNLVYAAECTKHHLLYVGQTKQKLSERFNGHRSDITCYPDRCELPNHFHTHGCDFDKDLRVTILEQHVTGSREIREFHEDKWILRLGTLAPNGMNKQVNTYGKIYQNLFN